MLSIVDYVEHACKRNNVSDASVRLYAEELIMHDLFAIANVQNASEDESGTDEEKPERHEKKPDPGPNPYSPYAVALLKKTVGREYLSKEEECLKSADYEVFRYPLGGGDRFVYIVDHYLGKESVVSFFSQNTVLFGGTGNVNSVMQNDDSVLARMRAARMLGKGNVYNVSREIMDRIDSRAVKIYDEIEEKSPGLAENISKLVEIIEKHPKLILELNRADLERSDALENVLRNESAKALLSKLKPDSKLVKIGLKTAQV